LIQNYNFFWSLGFVLVNLLFDIFNFFVIRLLSLFLSVLGFFQAMGNACTTTDMTLSFAPVLPQSADVKSRHGHTLTSASNGAALVLWGGATEDDNIYILKNGKLYSLARFHYPVPSDALMFISPFFSHAHFLLERND
jgi:hypothetical protein